MLVITGVDEVEFDLGFGVFFDEGSEPPSELSVSAALACSHSSAVYLDDGRRVLQ